MTSIVISLKDWEAATIFKNYSMYKWYIILVGWFYSMSTLVGLFYTKVSLMIMDSNYIQYKNLSSQSF